MANEVKLVLTAEDNISSAIKKVTEYLGESGLAQSITAAATSFTALTQIAGMVSDALGKVNAVIQEGINDAAQAELVNKRLAMSMAGVGQYTEESFIAINEWAGGLESATGVSDEALRSLVSLGIQYGMNTEQAQKAAEAAMNLAAATGQDMDTAFRQMSMTLSGTAGKLEKFIPELRTLSAEQLKNGDAIAIISKKYDGFSGATANTYIGAQQRIDSAIGNVKEAFGRMIAQNPAFIASMQTKADIINKVSESIDKLSTWVLNNQEDIKLMAKSIAAAGVIVAGYTLYMNAATVATIAFNTASAIAAGAMAIITSPITLVVAAVAALGAGFYLLVKNIDLVTGALQLGLGKALEYVMIPLGALLNGMSSLVGVFNADLGKSLSNAAESMQKYTLELQKSGQANMDLANSSKEAGKATETSAMMAGRAVDGLSDKINQANQETQNLRNSFSNALGRAETAFAGLKEFMPRMNLSEFQEDAGYWKKSIDDLRKYGEALQVKLKMAPDSAETQAELNKVNEKVAYAKEAQKALEIKNAQEIRNAVLQEEQIRLNQIKDKELTVANEIMMMRLDNAKQIRDRQIAIEEERILASRGLATADAQAGVSAQEQAQINANQRELAAYKAQLEAQKALAVDVESQKQLELANLKASMLSTNTASGVQAKNDVELIQAQQKQAQLQQMYQQGTIDEQAYQDQITQIQIDSISSRTASEISLNNQRAAALGQTPEGLQAQLESARMQNEAQNMILQERYINDQLTDAEFQAAKLEQEEAFLAQSNGIKEQYYQKEVERNQRTQNQWGVTLANIRLQQQKHGDLMGTLKGIQQSQEYAAAQNALTALSSLRQSNDSKAFEVGKAAAIAQATVNTLAGATGAYASLSPIPFVGPALATAAAAAIMAAGMMQVAQIKNQKKPAAHGGIDEVPKSMNNSTFLLKAGERVVQPEQNKELGQAIDKINNGGGSGGHVFNMSFSGSPDNNIINQVKQAVMDALRESSERGVPVINEKGIVRG